MALVALIALEAGWLAFDGGHAIVTGDYVTPSAGPYTGQLGPWAALVRAIGVDPRSTEMHVFFLAYGMVWLVAGATMAPRLPRGKEALAALAAGALWYLPFGTLLSAVQLAILASLESAPTNR